MCHVTMTLSFISTASFAPSTHLNTLSHCHVICQYICSHCSNISPSWNRLAHTQAGNGNAAVAPLERGNFAFTRRRRGSRAWSTTSVWAEMAPQDWMSSVTIKKRQCGWRTHKTTRKQRKHNFCYTLLTTEGNGTFCNCRAKFSHWCFNFPLRHVHVSPPLVRARAAQPDRVLTQTASFSPPLPHCSVGVYFLF